MVLENVIALFKHGVILCMYVKFQGVGISTLIIWAACLKLGVGCAYGLVGSWWCSFFLLEEEVVVVVAVVVKTQES